jgi:dipeptidyl aminopeptidase/acylaminoacyl peptidase
MRRGGRFLLTAAGALLAAAPVSAQRAPVLRQITVPHPYYYREMYLPQVTSGPGQAAWSPDGRDLVYAMQGTLWRQRLGTTEAVQLTDGPGYDSQPDWSPDGRWIVYTSYRDDALELRILDTTTGATQPLVADGAVNLDARWSPDGSRIAFVSTAFEGRWHVWIVPVAGGRVTAPPERITEDRDSGLPRYYYSRFDHYLSPAWSPDGRELLLVSNRGHIWGTGGLWRMEARAGAPMREIRDEETNWKARPDWASDGRRVAYSSYLGGQRNHLWLVPAGGGDPFELTYGDGDHTAPRWSPDGRRIAYVSNETGNTSLRVVTVPGGRTGTVVAATRRYLHPAGALHLRAVDGAGTTLPARFSVTGADGRGWAPDGAWRHADDGFDRAARPVEASYFHAAGPVTLALPEGTYTVEAFRGLEYAPVTRTVRVAAGAGTRAALRLARLADLPARGWWSGDLHVHMNYGGAYRTDPARLRAQAEAEDLHVVEDLIVNKEQRVPDVAMFLGRPDPVSTPRTIVAHDQEYHTSWWGHTGHLGLREHLILPDYAGYANTAAASLFPDNAAIFDIAHAEGSVSGYVHPFEIGAPDPAAAAPFAGGLVSGLAIGFPVDVALGKVDYVEVVGFSDHRTTAEVWYRLLNAGFRLPAGAGTDAMANFASLRGPVGLNRVFVHSGSRLDYRGWLAALKAGRTFATNGPLLAFSLDGHEAGDEISLPAGVHQLTARITLRSLVPVEHLEIVANGTVVAPIPLSAGGTRADAVIPLPVARSGWFTLRAWSAKATAPVMDLYPFATTSPVYVTIGGKPVRSAADARWFIRWIEQIETAAGAHPGWNSEAEKREVMARLAAAKAEFQRRAEDAGR